jgi:hypothetical protein
MAPAPTADERELDDAVWFGDDDDDATAEYAKSTTRA